eukprot:CAMPEP_0118814096 /NCGR_PEP_ID=MMETSP1162-20130426/3369_1 /TAXON_ID=33656 /ORGANISM="Phaeocystis Sp, Strain CCMP2710" /LENGTH=58 /DNA_ID=CAMNT_0006743959 /DNA_START=138 /DNA_END=311 /DNA_ORIENTATION=+
MARPSPVLTVLDPSAATRRAKACVSPGCLPTTARRARRGACRYRSMGCGAMGCGAMGC